MLTILSGPHIAAHTAKSPIETWPYEKLVKQSELIIIARATSVRDAKPGDSVVPGRDYLVGVITAFRVDCVLKGEYTQKELEVVHFRYKEGARIQNGPFLVSFKAKPIDPKTDIAEELPALMKDPEYLIFLRKRSDGRWECVSGINTLLSVKKVTRLDFETGEALP
jgi:hypothetical protein